MGEGGAELRCNTTKILILLPKEMKNANCGKHTNVTATNQDQ